MLILVSCNLLEELEDTSCSDWSLNWLPAPGRTLAPPGLQQLPQRSRVPEDTKWKRKAQGHSQECLTQSSSIFNLVQESTIHSTMPVLENTCYSSSTLDWRRAWDGRSLRLRAWVCSKTTQWSFRKPGKVALLRGISRSRRKVLLVLLWGYIPNICPCSFISTGINVMSSSVIQILPWKSDFAPRIVEMNLDFISIGFT